MEFFKKGHNTFVEKPDIEMETVIDNINTLRTRAKVVERKMQDRHAVVPKVRFIAIYNYIFRLASF